MMIFWFIQVFWFLIGMDLQPIRRVGTYDLAATVVEIKTFGVFGQNFGV